MNNYCNSHNSYGIIMIQAGGDNVIKVVKIRLKPTKEQEKLMWKSAGCARFTYNWGLAKANEDYKNGIKLSIPNIRRQFNALKKTDEFSWLNDVSAQITGQAFQDLKVAFDKFFKGEAKKPQFKSKRKSKISFYARYDAIKFNGNTVQLEKLGKIKFKYNKEIPQLVKYNNPRVSFDGMYWYLSLGFKHELPNIELTGESIGIDVGIKDLAIISSMEKPIPNINKTAKVRKVTKKLKRLQRQVSKKYELNKQGKKFIKTANTVKLERKIKKVHRKLHNIRQNHLHQATALIVKTKPSRIVMENINVTGMMKNKHLSKAILEQSLTEFKRQIKYKSKFYGIEFVEADRFYPSSKTCSCCGSIKKDLKLSDRIYKCGECGLIIDRDKNAAINLSQYKVAE